MAGTVAGVCRITLKPLGDFKRFAFGFFLGPFGVLPFGADRKTAAAGVVDIAGNGRQHLDRSFGVVAVGVGHGTAIADDTGRFGFGKLHGQRLDFGRRNPADFFRPLGCVLRQVGFQCGHFFVSAVIAICGGLDERK